MTTHPFDEAFANRFTSAIETALDLIEHKHEYAGGFLHLARALERVEEDDPEYAASVGTQTQLRIVVKRLWDAYIRESKDREKMQRRMDAHKPTQDEIERAMAASREPSRSDFKRHLSRLPEELRRKWDESPRGGVVRRQIINDYLDQTTHPIAEAYEGSRRQIFYMGALYNHALPQIIQIVQGMAQQLFPPKAAWRITVGIASPEPKRIRVTSQSIRSDIADFLSLAERFALELAELTLKRDRVRETFDE